MTTRKDQEIDWVVRKYAKDLVDSRMGVCPSVKYIRHRMSPNKTLWDMLNDDAMKNMYRASMNKC